MGLENGWPPKEVEPLSVEEEEKEENG